VVESPAASADASVASVASVAPPSCSTLARSASASRAAFVSGAWNRAAAPDSDAFMAPASLLSRTSRDSRSASLVSSSGESARPSRYPPLTTRGGMSLAKSRRLLAASTGSPLTSARALGHCSKSSNASTPASLSAILVRVFLTTRYDAFSPSARRSSASCATVSPRYSVSTAASDSRNASVSSATAAALSDLSMGLLPVGRLAVDPTGGTRTTKKPRTQAYEARRARTYRAGMLLRHLRGPSREREPSTTRGRVVTGGLRHGHDSKRPGATDGRAGAFAESSGCRGGAGARVDGDAGAHRRGERDLLDVPALGGGRLEPDHLVDRGVVVLHQLL